MTVNGSWPGQPPFIRPFLNPCLTCTEIDEAERSAAEKEIGEPVHLIFVGRLETEKGAGRAIEILSRVRRAGPAGYVGSGRRRPGARRIRGFRGGARSVG